MFTIIFFQHSEVSSKSDKEFEKKGEIIWSLPTKGKYIALTFDDGPHAEYTPQILDLLAQYDAKATFFIVGSRIEPYLDIIKRQLEEGHEHANHTYDHKMFRKLSDEAIKEEIRKTAEEYERLTGHKLDLFRPPGGQYNDRIVRLAMEEGYQVVMWSWHQDTRDWSKPGVQNIVANVLYDTRPGDIVLLHDSGGDRKQTVEALKHILPALKKSGWRMVTVSELILIHTFDSEDLK